MNLDYMIKKGSDIIPRHMFNRTGVAGAVLQTPLSLIN